MTHVLTGASAVPAQPAIRNITFTDLTGALRAGWEDFSSMPSHAIFLCIIYPAVGIVLAQLIFGYAILPFLFPLAAGFALIGPVAAIGLYELSRRREAGLESSATNALDVLQSPSIGAITALGGLMLVVFGIWIAVAHAIYVANFGYAMPSSFGQFVYDVLATRPGWNLIVIGNLAGLIFATLILVIGAVSFPLLLDCDVGAAVALDTSVRLFARNPVTMALWGVIVAALLLVGSLPLFIGLAVVLPVLGHATWHLYRKAVDTSDCPRAQFREVTRVHRYAADFPASLFR
jgi:uncharacterized membrane protein